LSYPAHYLDDVRLHLRLDVVVRVGDEVRVRVGPVNAYAGAGSTHRRTAARSHHRSRRRRLQPARPDRARARERRYANWARVREILGEQDRIFRCGLALLILRPIPLTGSILNEVEVAGRRVAVTVLPEPPRLTRNRLWLRAAVRASAFDDEPIRIDGR
jgi:hypothetical protein